MNSRSEYYLKRARAAAKEIELGVPKQDRAKKDIRIEHLFPLAVSYVDDLAYKIVNDKEPLTDEEKLKLIFASKFFTSYVLIDPDSYIEEKYLVIGSAAGYLCDRVGDASLLVSKINCDSCNKNPMFVALLYVLKNEVDKIIINFEDKYLYLDYLQRFLEEYRTSLNMGNVLDDDVIQNLKHAVYTGASDNELLLVDLLLAVCKMKCIYSTPAMIKNKNSMSESKKTLLLEKKGIIKEFWPAQRLMLEKGFFNGKSGIIQLPTGAGKTKSISLCVYSYFASFQKNISVIVSPFRALCRETATTLKRDLKFDSSIDIVELTDVMNSDYEIPLVDDIDHKSVVVVTPEKLLYVLRHEPEFATYIGQIIFDEGHLFEDDNRGAKYELLVASILQLLKEKPQIIMISAIVAGVDKINQWISDGDGEVISEVSIATTEKYTAALSQRKHLDKWYLYLDYLNDADLGQQDFFVPRFIEQKYYIKNNKKIAFPQDNKDASIATMLRLAKYANCALFTGRKDGVNSLAKRIVDISKYMDVEPLSERNDEIEQEKLSYLILNNYGKESIYYKASKLGVFLHHAGIAEGIKASVEYAMAGGKITNIICTSTLSQGVNLPIKYLIIDSIYQGKEPIEKQDFKNLIGRVGRSGMFTEGTVIYADPIAYKEKDWRWNKFVELYHDSKKECYSQLLYVCGYYSEVDLLSIIKQYYLSEKKDEKSLIEQIPGNEIKEKIEVWNHIKAILGDLESFIAQWGSISDDDIKQLIKRTLLLQSAGQECGERLAEVFRLIENYLCSTIPNLNVRISYSKSLLSVEDYIILEKEVDLFICKENISEDEIREWCVERIYNLSNNKALTNFELNDVKMIASQWVKGSSYGEILKNCKDIKVKWGQKKRKVKLEDISAICDSGFNYSATIVLNAINELLMNEGESYEEIAEHVSRFLLMLKYGLPDMNAIYIYEIGLNDRYVAQEVSKQIPNVCKSKYEILRTIKDRGDSFLNLISKFPSFYRMQLLKVIQ